MKNIKRLNILLRVMMILGIGAYLLMLIMATVGGYSAIDKIVIDGETLKEWNPIFISKLIINTICFILCLIGINTLRIATEDFYRRQLFNDVVSKAFKRIGQLIIIGTLIYIILNWFAEFFFSFTRTTTINASYLINASAALFFFTLSTMIEKAKGIQNEND
ncbi:hypothetical protein [Nonlabens sp.]